MHLFFLVLVEVHFQGNLQQEFAETVQDIGYGFTWYNGKIQALSKYARKSLTIFCSVHYFFSFVEN